MLEKFIGFVIKLVLIGIGLYAILCVILVCNFMIRVAKWNYFEDFTAEQREYDAQLVALPEIADYIKRYGTSGFQDVDGKVETRTFSSLDELCAIMSPDMQKAIRNTMDKEADANSKKKASYRIWDDELPAELREANENNFYDRHYFICTNKRGEYYLKILFPLDFFNDSSIKDKTTEKGK